MDKDFLIFLLWVAFILLGQVTKGKRKKQKKIPLPEMPPRRKMPETQKNEPDPFICEQARETGKKQMEKPLQPDLKQDLRPLHSDLQKDIRKELRSLRPTVAPQVAENKSRPRPAAAVHPRLRGNLREGMLWAVILGQPRCKKSWREEQKQQ